MDELQAIKARKEKETAIIKHEEVNTESLIAKAIESNVPIETMERLLAMRTQLKEEAAREAFFDALARFQSEMPTIQKKKKVYSKSGAHRYSYAPLESIIEQVKEPLKNNGFSYTLKSSQNKSTNELTVICEAHHFCGHTEKTEVTVPVGNAEYMSPVQEIGAATTYAKRYSFCNAFGIMTGDEDTDANVDAPSKDEPIDAPPPKPKTQDKDIKEKPTVKPENTALNLARTEAKKALRAAFEKSDVKGTELEFLAAVMASVGEKDLNGKKFEDLTEQEYWAVRKCALNW